MSKLADRIRKASRPEPAPFGFAAAAAHSPAPTMLVVVRLSSGEAGTASQAVSRGADAVIIEGDTGKLRGVGQDVVAGLEPPAGDANTVAQAREAGADFIVLESNSDAAALLEDKIGFVLSLPAELDDTHLRLLADLNLDAIVVPAPPPLTVGVFLEFRRLSALARTPLLVDADAGIEAPLLQALRESGAAGVVVPASATSKLGDLRSRIQSLPPRGKRREEHAEALVPAQTSAASHDHDDGDFDDD